MKQTLNPDAPTADVPNPSAAQDVLGEGAQTSETGLTTRQDLSIGEIGGGFTAADIKIPRLQIAYGVGDLAKTFVPGDFVLDKEHLLVHKGTPLTVIVLSVLGYWKEYLSQELRAAGARPRIFATEAEVVQNGGSTKWVDGIGPSFSRAADLKLLIQEPKDVMCGLFGLEIDGSNWTPAVWSVDKTAYKRTVPDILRVMSMALRRRGLHTGVWTLQTKIELVNKNATPVPVIRLADNLPEDAVRIMLDLFGGDLLKSPATPAPESE